MFKRKADSPQPAAAASVKPASKEVCLLGADVHFEGNLRFEGTLAIDGVVVGAITAPEGSGSLLTINQQARIEGDVTADTVLISGKVQGNVRARQRVELLRTGHLIGDIYTRDVMVEGGAGFEGYCHMERDGAVTAGDLALGGRSNGHMPGGNGSTDSPESPAHTDGAEEGSGKGRRKKGAATQGQGSAVEQAGAPNAAGEPGVDGAETPAEERTG